MARAEAIPNLIADEVIADIGAISSLDPTSWLIDAPKVERGLRDSGMANGPYPYISVSCGPETEDTGAGATNFRAYLEVTVRVLVKAGNPADAERAGWNAVADIKAAVTGDIHLTAADGTQLLKSGYFVWNFSDVAADSGAKAGMAECVIKFKASYEWNEQSP